MGDEEEGFALLRDQGQPVLLELAPGLRVDRRERLVHQQHRGVDGEGAGKADSLAHAARQLVRVGLLETLEADLADVALRHRLALGAGDAAQLEAEGDVAQHRRPGHQREVLEHEGALWPRDSRSEEHTSELQSLMRTSYAVFCWTKKNNNKTARPEGRTHENKHIK